MASNTTAEVAQAEAPNDQNAATSHLPKSSDEGPVRGPTARSCLVLLGICLLMVLLDFGGSLNIAPQTLISKTSYVADITKTMTEVIKYCVFLPGNCAKLSPFRLSLPSSMGGKILLIRSLVCKGINFTAMIKRYSLQQLGILLELHYGNLADRIGPKPVLLLGMAGLIISDIWIKVIVSLRGGQLRLKSDQPSHQVGGPVSSIFA